MAKIPGLGQAGALTPTVQRMVVQQGGSEAVAAGVRRLGNAIGAVAEDEAMLQQKRQHEADNLKVAADSMQLGNDLAVLRQRTQDDLVGGAIASRQDALKRFQDESTQLLSDYNQKAPQRLRPAARLRGDELFQRETLAMGGFLDNHATKESEMNLDTVRQGLMTQGLASEQALNQVKATFSDAVDANLRALRYTPDQVAALKQKFNDDATFMHFAQRLAEKPDDIKGIRALKARLADENQLTELDTARRVQLTAKAQSLIDSYEVEQRRKAAEAEASLATDYQAVSDAAGNGFDLRTLPPADSARLDRLLASKKYGESTKRLLDLNRSVSLFNAQSLPAQTTALAEAESKRRASKSIEDYNRQSDVIATLQKNFKQNMTAYKADPLTYTATKLMKQDVVPINWQDTATLSQQLSKRKEQAMTAGNVNGSYIPPITAQEGAALATLVDSLPPKQGAALMGAIRQGVGDANMPGVAGMMGKASDPLIVWTSLVSGRHTDIGRDPAELGLIGRGIIRNHEIKMPEARKMRAQLAAASGLTGNSLDVVFSGAQAIYATRAKERGVIEPINGRPDARLWKQAMDIATGGVYQYNGRPLVAPYYGMKQADFEDALASVRPADIARDAGGMKLYVDGQEISYEKAAKFVQEAPVGNGSQEGSIWIRAGSGMLMKQDGTPFLLTVPQTP